MLHLHSTRFARLFLTALVCLLLAAGTSSCGKRGDPYRPSEVSSSS
ncbi:hypothetical protein AB8880_12645 [Alphaproteobacteria bacterium LSUCC0684]